MRTHRKIRSRIQKFPSTVPFKCNVAVLAGSILLALGMATSAQATSFVVTSAADSGPGTLRQAAIDANASAGPHLIALFLPSGSTITLTSGDIEFTGPDVSIQGLGRDELTISGNHNSRIFDVQAGSLAISDLTLRDGLALGDATNLYDQAGGAIRVGPMSPPPLPGQFSAMLAQAHVDAANARAIDGRTRATRSAGLMAIRRMQSLQPRDELPVALTVDRVALLDNRAEAPDIASGGAIYVELGGTLVVRDSVVSGNSTTFSGGAIAAISADFYTPATAAGSIELRNTTFSGNHIDMNGTEEGQGGALLTYGPAVDIRDCVFTGNTINDAPLDQPDMGALGGGVLLVPSTLSVTIDNTEISGNTVVLRDGVYDEAGGLYCGSDYDTPVMVTNSTISGNSAPIGAGIGAGCNLHLYNTTIAGNISAGLHPGTDNESAVFVGQAQGLFNAQSTLIANPDSSMDLFLFRGDANLGVVSHSLVLHPDPDPAAPPLPPDTIIGIDPMLLPLANNGGSTQTQALPAGSVAIDAGNNVLALDFDQREAPYARVVGVAADIGAYELDGDRIFANGFD